MRIKKITPILNVESIEDTLPFWQDTLGYQAVATVPHKDRLGFAMLVHEDTAVMLQTHASVADDLPELVAASYSKERVVLYVDVESIDEVEAALAGAEILVPRRSTFYGAEEIWIREPSGAIIGFAQHKEG